MHCSHVCSHRKKVFYPLIKLFFFSVLIAGIKIPGRAPLSGLKHFRQKNTGYEETFLNHFHILFVKKVKGYETIQNPTKNLLRPGIQSENEQPLMQVLCGGHLLVIMIIPNVVIILHA